MARKITVEGRTYTFPAEATDEEISEALDAMIASTPQPTAPSATVPAKQERVKEPGKGANLAQRVVNFVTGDNQAQKGVGEIAYQSIPEEKDQRFESYVPVIGDAAAAVANALPRGVRNFVGAQQKAASIGAGFFLDPNEESRAAIIKKSVPTSQFRRDEYGNLQVRYTPSTPWAYVNRPGASLEDAQTIGNELAKAVTIAKTVPVANPMRYTGGLTRAAVAGAAGGAGTAAGQYAAQAFGGQGVNSGDVAVSTVASILGQGASDLASLGYGAAREGIKKGAFKLADFIDARLDKITPPKPTGQVTFDPRAVASRIAEGSRNAGAWLDDQARAAAARGNMGDYALADEFNVPLTRGQAQRNAEQIAREQAFARSGGSQEAREVMDSFKKEQGSALRVAGAKLATRGEEPLTESAGQAGARVAQGLEARQAAMEAQKNAAYNEFARVGSQEPVDAASVQGLSEAIDERLWTPASPVIPDDAQLPSLQSARRHLRAFEQKAATGGLDFAAAEEYRKGLNEIWRDAAPGSRDQRAVKRLLDGFNDWMDSYPYKNPQVAEARSYARRLHQEERTLFGVRDRNDAAGKALEKVLDSADMTGRDIVNTIIGSDIGSRQSALGAVRRIKEATLGVTAEGRIAARPGATKAAKAFKDPKGKVPPELQSLREAAVYRILAPLERATGEGGEIVTDIPIGTIRTNLKNALSDDGGGEIMRELFTAEEIARMQRFLRLLEQVTPPVGTVNYSNTAYTGGRMIRDWLQRFVQGTLGDGPAVAFSTLWGLPGRFVEGASAQQAVTRGGAMLPRGGLPAGAAASSAYGTLQNQDDAYGP